MAVVRIVNQVVSRPVSTCEWILVVTAAHLVLKGSEESTSELAGVEAGQ